MHSSMWGGPIVGVRTYVKLNFISIKSPHNRGPWNVMLWWNVCTNFAFSSGKICTFSMERHYWYPFILCSLLLPIVLANEIHAFCFSFCAPSPRIARYYVMGDLKAWHVVLCCQFSGLTVKENITCCWPFCQRNRMCISMELVTAVLGDHGQRPREDYGIVPS